MQNEELRSRVLEILEEVAPGVECLAMYKYGSRVYGYKDPDDHDVIVITSDDYPAIDRIQTVENVQLIISTRRDFLELMYGHDTSTIECVLTAPENRLYESEEIKRRIDKFELDVDILRAGCISSASACINRAQYQFMRNDKLRCKKGLFHALRHAMYAEQALVDKTIVDVTAANRFYPQIETIVDNAETWDDLYKEFHVIYEVPLERVKELMGL